MGYDYSRKYLDQHSETVIQLTELYNSQGYVAMEFDDQDALDKVRMTVSNVLASLALNFPKQYEDLRQKIRTWTEWNPRQEKWTLYVGAPRHKVPGRKPGLLPSTRTKDTYGPAAQTGREDENYTKLISNEEEYAEFVRWVATLGPNVQMVRAELSDPPTNDKFLKPFKAVGWKTSLDGPTTIQLKRPKNKEEDRNA